MPIRLNLLAEAQAAEQLRRRDPVKRAIWIAALLVAVMLAWSSSLQFKVMLANSELNRVEGQMNAHTNEYQQVLANQNRTTDINDRLAKLRLLATARFLNASVLNALQQTLVDDVQLVRFKAEQTCLYTEGTKAHTNEDRIIPGTPAKSVEKVVITLEGSDSSRNPGDQVNKFQQTVASHPFFKTVLAPTNGIILKYISSPQFSPGTGKSSAQFTLECRYPDKTR